VRKAYKYRLFTNPLQAELLTGQLREACSLYNAALQERIEAWKTSRVSRNYYDQANQLKEIRAAGHLALANYSCCQEVLRRVQRTFQAFFARVQRGERPGFPRYKSRRRFDSITFPSYGDGIKLCGAVLRIQGVGPVKASYIVRWTEGSRRLRSSASAGSGTRAFLWRSMTPRFCRTKTPLESMLG
jgi:putative transposase